MAAAKYPLSWSRAANLPMFLIRSVCMDFKWPLSSRLNSFPFFKPVRYLIAAVMSRLHACKRRDVVMRTNSKQGYDQKNRMKRSKSTNEKETVRLLRQWKG